VKDLTCIIKYKPSIIIIIVSLLLSKQILCRRVKKFLSNAMLKKVTPKSPYVFATDSSGVKTVAYRHRFAAYHNKHC